MKFAKTAPTDEGGGRKGRVLRRPGIPGSGPSAAPAAWRGGATAFLYTLFCDPVPLLFRGTRRLDQLMVACLFPLHSPQLLPTDENKID